MRDVRPIDIHRFITDTATCPSLVSFREKLKPLRCFFRLLYFVGISQVPVADYVRCRRPRPRVPKLLTESQVKRIIRAVRSPRDRALLELIYATGCRLQEIAGLNVERLDFRTRRARVLGKGKERIVYFGIPAALALRRYLGHRKTGPLFLSDVPEQRGGLSHSCSHWMARGRDPKTGKHRQAPVGTLSEVSVSEARRRANALPKSLDLKRPRARH